MLIEYFKIAVKNIRTRPMRSWLTILGILIGVFLIISLISLSEGLKGAVLNHLKMVGKDLIIIFPGQVDDIITTFAGGMELTEDDMSTIKKTAGVEQVIPFIYKAEVVRYQGKSKTLLVSGNPWRDALSTYQTDLGWSLTQGRWPVPGKREALIGSLVPTDVFPGIEAGDEIAIKGRQFEIVGVLKSLGSKQDDSIIALDLDIYKAVTGERKGALMAIAKAAEGYSIDEVAQNIKNNLSESGKKRKGEELAPYSVLTSEKATEIVGNILALIQFVIFGFASIAIVVGGIGIMNTMYTSVRERTREIGILKAVGAKNSAIISIFLIESGIIGLTGGLGGILLGFGFARSIEAYAQFHPVFYMKAVVSPGLFIFGLAFSFLVGCLSGFFPARSAAKLKPVEALRYE